MDGQWWRGRWGRAGLVAAVLAIGLPAFMLRGEPEVPGEMAPLGYVVKDMNGQDVNLADYRGRPLVVNFWAIDCGPCRAEIPAFNELVEKYRDQRLAVLGISLYDTPEELRPFAAEFKMNYPVLVGLGHDDLIAAYEADYVIPVTWFVRPDGTVSVKKIGTDTKDWFEQQIKALF